VAYDGANAVRFYDANWRIIHGPGTDDPLVGRFVLFNQRGILYWMTDGNGRQYAVGDSTGGLPSNPWGVNAGASYRWAGAATNWWSFAASRQANADQGGVSLFRNRQYDAKSGHWLQEDPIGIAGGLNLYQFNGNNPAAYTDPFGLSPCQQLGNCTQSDGGQNGLWLQNAVRAVGNYLAQGWDRLNTVEGITSFAVATGTGSLTEVGGAPNLAPEAIGAHSTFRTDPQSGRVTHYETRRPQSNPQNPNLWETVKRYDATGKAHFNKATQQYVPTPHVHDPTAPGGVRLPTPDEIPGEP
jgi:RHS repeat-associated protein